MFLLTSDESNTINVTEFPMMFCPGSHALKREHFTQYQYFRLLYSRVGRKEEFIKIDFKKNLSIIQKYQLKILMNIKPNESELVTNPSTPNPNW